MNILQKFLYNWKASFNFKQKTKSFVNGLNNLSSININDNFESEAELNFLHSGHLGDIIYAIPAIYCLAKGKPINLFLKLNEPVKDFIKSMTHPNGNVMLTNTSVKLLQPLILKQKQFKKCEAHNNQKIHYDLTLFRNLPFDYRMGSITRWYFLTFGISTNLSNAWLSVKPNIVYKNFIVIARSKRYRTPLITYSFLKKYLDIVFVGVQEEFIDMQKEIPHITFVSVQNFLELAEIIAGCKIFIGNQSFPFSLAESLKVKRVLETFPQCPNVIPEGENAYDFCYQPQFEKIIEDLHKEIDTI